MTKMTRVTGSNWRIHKTVASQGRAAHRQGVARKVGLCERAVFRHTYWQRLGTALQLPYLHATIESKSRSDGIYMMERPNLKIYFIRCERGKKAHASKSPSADIVLCTFLFIVYHVYLNLKPGQVERSMTHL